MIQLEIPKNLLDRDRLSPTEIGSYTTMVHTPEISKYLEVHYGRKNLALKVLTLNTAKRVEEGPRWGRVSLRHATIIQNLFAREGRAPRVFGWVAVNGLVAQVTEYLELVRGSSAVEHRARVEDLIKLIAKYNLKVVSKNLDAGMRNWRGDKFVDFSHFQFRDFEGYVASLGTRARIRRGEVLSKAYQPIEEIGVTGTRNIKARIENLRLQDISWEGKNVLDVGCNFGIFCRYAVDAGARRVVGIDRKGDLAFEINNVLGYWNLDIIQAKLPGIRLPRFDIVLMMAFHNYVGGLEAALTFIAPVVNNLLIVESHGGEDRDECEQVLQRFFPRVDYLGYIEDPMIRHQWYCWK